MIYILCYVQMPYNLRSRMRKILLNEDERNDECFGGRESEDELDCISEDSDSEFELSDDDSEIDNACLASRLNRSRGRGRPTTKLRGKNGFQWSTRMPTRRSERLCDVQDPSPPELLNEATNCQEIEEFWELLLNNEIFHIIIQNTNNKIEQECLNILNNEQKLQTYHHQTNHNEMKAFIALLYYAGLWKSSHVQTHELWSKESGVTFYRSVMSRARFMFLSTCLRFDNKIDRNKEGPIRAYSRTLGHIHEELQSLL